MMNRLFRPVRTALSLRRSSHGGCRAVPAQDSPHGKIAFACEECHSADSWKVMPEPTRFDHRKTGFALKGEHAQAGCMDCHTSLTFRFKKSFGALRGLSRRRAPGASLERHATVCHAPQSWLVPDMVQRHASTRFFARGKRTRRFRASSATRASRRTSTWDCGRTASVFTRPIMTEPSPRTTARRDSGRTARAATQ